MSIKADANRVALRSVKEVTEGVTPPTPQMQDLRYTGESFTATVTSIQSNEIRADRNISDIIQTGEDAAGDFNFEWSAGTHDEFLSGMAQNPWVANVLVGPGTTRSSYSIEKYFTDINKGEVYEGSIVNTFDLAFQQGSAITGKFGFICYGATPTTAPLDATPTPAMVGPIFNLTTDLSSFLIAGAAYEDGVQSFNLSMTNNLRAQPQIGSKRKAGVGNGSLAVTGSMNAYFGNATSVINAFRDQTYIPIEFTMSKFGNSYKVEMPKVKIATLTHVAGGINTDVQLALTFQAVVDSGIGGTYRITRVIAP